MTVSGSLPPVERPAGVIPGGDEALDSGGVVGDRREAATAQPLAGDHREDHLDQCEPRPEVGVKCRRIRGWWASEAQTAGCSWVASLSTTRCRWRAGGDDLLAEGRELLAAVPLGAGLADPARDDLPRGNSVGVPRRTQSKLAVFRMPRTYRQGRAVRWSARIHGFSSTQSITRPLRRMQIQPDDLADLASQLPIGGEREGQRPPRLDIEAVQIRAMMTCEIGVPSAAGAAAGTPRRLAGGAELGRRLGQRQLPHPITQRLRQRRRFARPRGVLQPGQPELGAALSPGDHRRLGERTRQRPARCSSAVRARCRPRGSISRGWPRARARGPRSRR
jgi:hypothetical protein